ncbi:MAG: CoA transferase [Acidimicrobiia bacterium]|nr:CoA transferase [Acidimicrobiia bacterium]
MAKALDDVVVVDLTTEMWGGLASALLGDFGADVIRVEDLSRSARDPDRDGRHPPEPIDPEAELIHRNKRSLGLDLRRPAGSEALERLLRTADVLLTDLPFADLEDARLTYDVVVDLKPDLVYARGSGFGPRGPDRDLPALDELAAARTGLMPALGEPGQPPVYAGHGQMYTAVQLAFGVLAALRHRERAGEGQVVDASLFGGNLYAATLTVDAYLATRDDRLSDPVSRLDTANPMSGASLAYPTSDGRWVTLTMPDSDRWWPAFSTMMGIDADDPRFATHDLRCGEGRQTLMALLDDLFSKHPASHWRERFQEYRLSADVIEKHDYPASDEAARINRYVISLERAGHGRFEGIGFPIHLGETPAEVARMAPRVGEHSREILRALGYSPTDVDELERQGVAGTARATVPATWRRGGRPAAAEPVPTAGAGALGGIRVLDLTVWLQGPLCAQHLADFGAEVIHVERPGTGDQARGVRSINAVPVADWNQYFLATNRNKKSLAVDLKSAAGREIFDRLVAESDVFLSNLGTDSLRAAGLGYERLSSINPRLVYTTNTGYGPHGPDKPAFDQTVQALTGLMTRSSEPGQPPVYLGLGAGDAYGGLLSALGIVVALHHRERTGRGQHVDASLYGAQLLLSAPTLQPYLATRDAFYADQHARTEARNPLWNRYRASDRWFFLCLEHTDESWSRLCRAMGCDDLADDPRFPTREQRCEHTRVLVEALDARFARRVVADWMACFRQAGIPAAEIGVLADVADDAQAWANDYLVGAHCSEVDREVQIRGLPVTLSRTPGRVEALGPELGQDTEMILFETLGISWDEIGELKAAGAIP